jgi:hypothetical protein
VHPVLNLCLAFHCILCVSAAQDFVPH